MAKGPQFERDLSRKLSLWWTDNDRDDVFWRTSSSGARATSRAKSGKKTAYEGGDIRHLDPIGEPLIKCFLLELKRGYNSETDLLDLLNPKKKSLLMEWWTKAEMEKRRDDRRNHALILHRDRKNTLIFLEHDFVSEQESKYSGNITFPIIVVKNSYDINIISLDNFFTWVSPEDIKMRLK